MTLNPEFYEGRGQALVKHTFLDRYMRDALPKVLGRYTTFAYVDLFAGPWKSQCPQHSDTSFGIALRRMIEAKEKQAKLGRNIRLIAHLVEKDRHRELDAAVAPFRGEIEITCYPGLAEKHAGTIQRSLPANSFRYVVIDPKGLPDIRQFAGLMDQGSTEVLVNFMLQFASRFLATDRMPKLVEWLGQVAPGSDWQSKVAELSSERREDFVTEMARKALRRIGGYRFAPAITVDETSIDRTLYKLIYLSRSDAGLKVFRDAQVSALSVQAETRTQIKADKRAEKTKNGDIFSLPGVIDPGERSALALQSGRRRAFHFATEVVKQAGPQGVSWRKLWTEVLDGWVVTQQELKDEVVRLKNCGDVAIPTLAVRQRVPKDEDIICWAGLL